MRNKLLVLLAALTSAVLLSAPRAEAIGPYCSTAYCADKPAGTFCVCPKSTDRPGNPATCGSWRGVPACWYG